MGAFLRRLLAHQLTASLDLDDPATTTLRREIIASKSFLKAIYDEWYRMLAREVPAGTGDVLELGSGAGYCARFIQDLITSDVFACPAARVVIDARKLPFGDSSLRAIVMTNVLHHIRGVERFFAEASRCLRQDGKIVMIEPWVTSWSRFVYKHLHHEPFDPQAADWSFAQAGPLSGANEALPWIVFQRDRQKFETCFPELTIEEIQPLMPFRYLISGGVGYRSLMPGFTYSLWAGLEKMLESQIDCLGMFALIAIRRR